MATVAAFLALGGGALAARSLVSSDGHITGCVSRSGLVRVIQPGHACGRRDRQLIWNQTGRRGLRGPKGDTGGRGPKGDTGAAGSSAAGSGAVPVSQTLPFGSPYDTQVVLAKFDGFQAVGTCNSTASQVVIVGAPNGPVSFFGDQAEDGKVTRVDATESDVRAAAHGSGALDGTVEAAYSGRWARVDLGTYHGGSGCNFYGVVVPTP
jgi:hypothetical protein